MTRLLSGGTRGFFDPITLGFFVDGDIGEGSHFLDDITLVTYATYYHEITHYLQFFGTTLGNLYLHHCWSGLFFGIKGLRLLQASEQEIRPPFNSFNIEFPQDIAKHKFVHDRCQRFFMEELFGFTYPIDDISPATDGENRPRYSSPLVLRVSDDQAFLVTARTILEHQAVLNEQIVLNGICSDKGKRDEITEKIYSHSNKVEHSEYHSLSQEIHKRDLFSIEPIIYFVVLNQAEVAKVGWQHSEYISVRALKRIFEKFPYFSDLQFPKTDSEFKSVVETICEVCGLVDPFSNLEQLLELRSKEQVTTGSTVVRISRDVIQWVVENPLNSILWPKNPEILEGVPILNIRDETNSLYSRGNSIATEYGEDAVLDHRDYGWLMYLVGELFHKETFACPAFVSQKPALCRSCEACSGRLPDGFVFDDCPMGRMLGEQGIDVSKWRE